MTSHQKAEAELIALASACKDQRTETRALFVCGAISVGLVSATLLPFWWMAANRPDWIYPHLEKMLFGG